MYRGEVISLAEARARVLEQCPALSIDHVPLAEALGCVTAEVIVAREAVPAFANTAMDGYAVRSVDITGAPVRLAVVGTLSAGSAPPDHPLVAGETLRIMTGAPMPSGADAVIMVEQTQAGDGGTTVTIQVPAKPGDHVRRAGEDVSIGQEVFPPHTRLGPGHLGVLASLGITEVAAFPRVRVGVLSTGDELVEGPGLLRPGQIRDSNRRTLLALAAASGFEPVDLGIARDTEGGITEAIEAGTAGCDALVTSGGVSMGDFDWVKTVLNRLSGDSMGWMQVAIRPAKPLAFGVVDGVPVFGLPGNPVSSMVSFELFTRPALRQMTGHLDLDRLHVSAVADEGLPRRSDGKLHLVRVIAEPGADGPFHVRSSGGQGSHQLLAMARSNALALLPDGDGVEPGGQVRTMLLDC